MTQLLSQIQYGFSVESKGARRALIEQVHGTEIIELTGPSHRETLQLHPQKADGVITKAPDVELHIFTADCLPVLLFSTQREGAIAAIHCGWRGALKGIVRQAYEKIQSHGNEIQVVFGPSIMGCCFEVKEDFVNDFENAGKDINPFLEKSRGRMFFDLPRYVREVELAQVPEHLFHRDENRCTYCSAPPLPSYRRNGGTDPRIRAWIRKS